MLPFPGAVLPHAPHKIRPSPPPCATSWDVIASFLERTLPALILVVAVIGAPMMILSAEGLPRLRALEKELAQVHRENGEQRRQIEFLRKTVQNLKDNPDAVERIARDELGLVRKNEVVFQFSTAKGGP
jgi:cell division protein FtsB